MTNCWKWNPDEVDEKALPGLHGIVKISHTVINRISLINFDGIAPASQWEDLSAAPFARVTHTASEEASK
jgi:hypothetical protein